MVRIRCARGGRNKSPFYRIVVADSRSPRDGKFIDQIGHFNPLLENLDGCKLDLDKMQSWIEKGAQLSPKVKSIYKAMLKAQK